MQKKGGWGRVYQDVTRNSNISAAAKGVYAYLSALCGISDECYPSVETITKEMGMGKDTFYRHINALVAAGIVEKHQVVGEDGKFGCTIYHLAHEVTISEKQSFPCTENEDTDNTDTENKETISNISKSNNIKSNNMKGKAPKTVKVYFPGDALLNQAFADYVEMRKQIKKPMTDRAVALAIKKLQELSAMPFSDTIDSEMAIQILNQSIMNSWQGLFPLKEDWKKEKGGAAVGRNQNRGQAADFYERFMGTGNGD